MSLPAELQVRKPEALPLGLDQQPLFELGLRQVRAYARERWTDHNIHDPGITALELLCHAITDLCYRASYPIEDLLAAPGDNRAAMAKLFHGARPALGNRPLTALDYRKLLIDVPGVRNAWIHPVKRIYFVDTVEAELKHADPGVPGVREVALQGLFGALVEFADPAATPAQQQAVLDAVAARLQANRSLCQDFAEVQSVETQDFRVCAEIEIEPNADAARVQAAVLAAVQQHLRPGVRRYRRSELLERRNPDGTPYLTDPDLFDGPVLENGFIDAAELAQAGLRTVIRLSDVISLLMDLEGVKAIREIVVRPVGEDEAAAPGKWEIPVAERKRATLDAGRSRLVLYKGSMPVPATGWPALYEQLLQQAEAAFAPRRPTEERPIPLGQYRNPAAYTSVQTHFPALYGIGEAGLAPGAGPAREAQAKQLQGYLLLFDQLMADYMAQLGHARELLSFAPEVERSYRCQAVESFRDFRRFYPAAPSAAQRAEEDEESKTTLEAKEQARRKWRERVRGLLESRAEDDGGRMERRNRFLDHLLARFAERLQHPFGVAASAKCAFLRQYPELGAERGRGFDQTLEAGAPAHNLSGLEKRLAHLLGLGSLFHEIYQERDTDGVDEYRFRVLSRASGNIVLSSTRHWATQEQALAALGPALDAAAQPGRYQRMVGADGKHYFDVVDEHGDELARRDQPFASVPLMEAAIAELIALVAAYRGERLLLIENILLRPAPGEPFLTICRDPDCGEDCPGNDPYSYRLHVILPAEAPRLRDMAFRRYAEEVIREEAPAHLLPKVCFVSNADLQDIEAAWLAWRALLSGSATGARGAKLAALRDALEKAKNVYPASQLGDCRSDDKFILGRSALGSAPPGE